VISTVLGEYGMSLDAGKTDLDLQDIVSSYEGRGGVFRVLVADDGRIVGCGGLYPLTADSAEIRKMYFLPEARGRGLGKRLLEDLVAFAREHGYKTVVLETASVLKTAIAMYRSYGFVETPRDHLATRCDRGFRLTL
jgi:putative acetyltransferase